MRLFSIFVLACLLGCVYWLGATVYSDNIEADITERSSAALTRYESGKNSSDTLVTVDGRDVTVFGSADSHEIKDDLLNTVDGVWGVRRTLNDITVSAKDTSTLPGFDFSGNYNDNKLHLSGFVDKDEVVSKVNGIHNALPPSTVITLGTLTTGAAPLINSKGKVETGIAALTQLNNGTLKITDREFILSGTVSDQDRLEAIDQLLATRADVLAPLRVIQNIAIEEYLQVTDACRSAIANTMQDNTVNYKVDHYNVEPFFAGKLDNIADMVTGVCDGQIAQVLVEGHADFTGGEGYNQGLSERRAGAAQHYLEGKGVPYSTIAAFGYGEFRPIASNETANGRSQNRRTEIHITTIPVSAGTTTTLSTLDE